MTKREELVRGYASALVAAASAEGDLAVLEDALKSLGFVCERMAFEGDGGAPTENLYARLGTASPNFCFAGHTDVVPVEGQEWSSDPFVLRRDGGRLYGRGAVDMKGFGAVALAMIPEFKKAALRRPIHILLSYDEETTCLGPLDMIARLGVDLPRPNAVIVGEHIGRAAVRAQ